MFQMPHTYFRIFFQNFFFLNLLLKSCFKIFVFKMFSNFFQSFSKIFFQNFIDSDHQISKRPQFPDFFSRFFPSVSFPFFFIFIFTVQKFHFPLDKMNIFILIKMNIFILMHAILQSVGVFVRPSDSPRLFPIFSSHEHATL